MALKTIPERTKIEEILPKQVADKIHSLKSKFNILVEHSQRREVALGNDSYSFKRIILCPKDEDPLEFIEKASARQSFKGALKGFSLIERDFHPVKSSLVIFDGNPQEYRVITGKEMTDLIEKALLALH